MVDKSSVWQDQSACKGKPVEWFFFKNILTEKIRPEVKELCANCPVRVDCLREALETASVGIWAGTTTKDRRKAKYTKKSPPHGTMQAYNYHRRFNEPTCDDCKRAARRYEAKLRGGYVYGERIK